MSKEKDDLFNNPMVKKAKQHLTKEQIDDFKKQGEHMFKVDFEKTGDEQIAENVLTQLDLMLNSGLHPSYLSYEEKDFLTQYVGEKWYENYGYMQNDLHRINL
jgi:hypothetical protein